MVFIKLSLICLISMPLLPPVWSLTTLHPHGFLLSALNFLKPNERGAEQRDNGSLPPSNAVVRVQHAACVKQATSQWPPPRYVGLFGISHTQAARSPRLATLAPYRYSPDQLFAFNNTTGARLDSDLIRHLKKLSIGVNLPRKRSCRGAGGNNARLRLCAV